MRNSTTVCKRLTAAMSLGLAAIMAVQAPAKALQVAVVQTFIEDALAKNEAKLVRLIGDAGRRGCQLVIFPENALYWPEVSVEKPSKRDLDASIQHIAEAARAGGVYVIFGVAYKSREDGPYLNRGVAFNSHGKRIVFYCKNRETPSRFFVFGVPCNLSVCSDRGYLEHSDLPCLVQGSQVIIDTSGGHGGDDGRPDLRWIRYRPWAQRTQAYVIVSNPAHDDTDFMGHRPWGGGSAIIAPDGSIQASRLHEKDVMIVGKIDTDRAARSEAERRRRNPIFRSFWETGRTLLEGGTIDPAPSVEPLVSARRNIKIAAAQMACSRDLGKNTRRITATIRQAARQDADIVVFPELALTGSRTDDVLDATPSAINDALRQIQRETKAGGIYAVVGTPSWIAGQRRNCAVVVGDDGQIKTRYAQIATRRTDLFRPGQSAASMWFSLKGVHSIVTIGEDANWIEMGDLAANRGMCLHFHLSYEADESEDAALLRKQRNLLALSYAQFGAVVNAADPSGLDRPSSPASGGSLLVSREGGHNQPSPEGLEYYLPYQTSVVKGAAEQVTLISATRKTAAGNSMDLNHSWRNRNRESRPQSGWYDWIRMGAIRIGPDRPAAPTAQ